MMNLKQVIKKLEKRGTTKMWLSRSFLPMPRTTFWLYLKTNKFSEQQKIKLKKLLK